MMSRMNDKVPRWRQALGWSAVAASTAAACFAAFWGAAENFHEGWYSLSLWQNLGLMLVQYASPMLLLMLTGAAALRWPRVAIPLLGGLAVAAAWFFHGGLAAIQMFVVPLAVMAALYAFGRPEPRRWAWRVLLVLPPLTAIVCGAYPGWRAMHRIDDGSYGERRVAGNGVDLDWAPEGPGWPEHPASWEQATGACALLAADGRTLAATPQNLWRLPTVDEAVRSMVYRGQNAGGQWDPARKTAHYRVQPDKDSPLWKAHSQVIYWWTATRPDSGNAYRIAYNGYVAAFGLEGWGAYWSYRCVRGHGQPH